VEKVLRVTAEENSSARKLPHLDAPKAAGGITGAKDFIEARVERRGGLLLRTPTRSRDERRRHGQAQERNHENGEKPRKVLLNPNSRASGTAVNSRQSTVDSQSRQKGIHREQLTVDGGNPQKQFLFGFVFNPVHNVQARAPVENLIACRRPFESMGGILCGAGLRIARYMAQGTTTFAAPFIIHAAIGAIRG
jgi:hypothetical protein